MQSAILLSTALAFFGSALAAPQAPSSLTERADTPTYCQFEGKRGDFQYIDETPNETGGGTACFGWQTGTISCPPWSTDEVNDMINVLNQQIAKDGQLEKSTVGAWSAVFNLGTTAFPDHDIVIPTHELQRVNMPGTSAHDGGGSLAYYYSRNGNMLTISRPTCG